MRTETQIVRVARIDSHLEPYEWDFARQEAARIDAHWDALRVVKPKLYDGRVLLAHRLAVEDDVLRGAYFETSYRSFLAWRDFGFLGAPIANGFAMAALQSADGAFMLGEMSASTANGGRLYFPAGTPEPDDVGPAARVALEANVLRELEEETGLRHDEVTLENDWTIVFAGPLIGCMKGMRSRSTAAELEARQIAFNATLAEPELGRLVPVRETRDLDPLRMPDFMIRYLTFVLAHQGGQS